MVTQREVSWRERLKVIDYEVIRTQMARELGVCARFISESDVRASMKILHESDELALRRVYSKDRERPKRNGKRLHIRK